ncbi:hypothetical protein RHGRI_018602 [Rhododendron griersonianum]|uniref:Uncharacterized protein n=1 Tax=Rhododendron griersonianum TaxID=479676 RepID=A0AAV6K289_9ERIC|nr:hypothetical protein RHGRI_018602 [Rhododendron griersonianum]
MSLLVEGLGGGDGASIEEYIIGPANELSDNEQAPEKDQIRLYGAEEGVSWIAKPVTGQSTLGLVSRYGSMANQSTSLIDPTVTLFGSIHENLGDMGGRRSMLFSNFGSMFNMGDQGNNKKENEDVESLREGTDGSGVDSDDNLRSPLLSRQDTDVENPASKAIEQVSGMDIGGGWQLAYKVSEGKGEDGNRKGGGGLNQSALPSKDLISQFWVKSRKFNRQPLPKGQFSGRNGVLYYTPQILEQAGVGVLLSNLGIRPDSASFLISGVTTLLMLPSIGVAEKKINEKQKARVFSYEFFPLQKEKFRLYFVKHLEIFPTLARGVCIAICALTFWIGDIIVTYSLPVMLTSIGLQGVFGIYAVVCSLVWIFVFLKVPETKGMPLEVITEFFAVGAKQGEPGA